MRGHITPQAVRDEITEKIKNGALTVSKAAKEYGLADNTIYGWFGTRASGTPGTLELARLKRENLELARLVGMLTLEIETTKKKNGLR
jgi:transposase-like protein